MKIEKLYLLFLGLPKTIYVNFKYLSFREAIKLPIFISHKVHLSKLKGKINIKTTIKTGMIKIGFGDIAIFDKYRSRTILKILNNGSITFNGKTNIGHGSKLCVSGDLTFGNNFGISAESSIICAKKITFGDNCLLSWDVLVMDTDQHKIKTIDGRTINENKEILIGNHVWIGCRCTILKGTIIKNDNVIASNSILHGKYENSSSIIGGYPTRILKDDIYWQY